MQHTVERSSLIFGIGCCSFTDLDCADAVLLAELLHILTLGLGVVSDKASLLGCRWMGLKPKSSVFGDIDSDPLISDIAIFVLKRDVKIQPTNRLRCSCGLCWNQSGGSGQWIYILGSVHHLQLQWVWGTPWHIGPVRNCMTLLEKHVQKALIQTDTKVGLYRAYFPVSADVWLWSLDCHEDSCTGYFWHGHSVESSAFHIPDMQPISLSGRLPGALQFLLLVKGDSFAFGHVAHADSVQDHHRVIDG